MTSTDVAKIRLENPRINPGKNFAQVEGTKDKE